MWYDTDINHRNNTVLAARIGVELATTPDTDLLIEIYHREGCREIVENTSDEANNMWHCDCVPAPEINITHTWKTDE